MVMDGNFTAEHLRTRRPDDDVWLGDGHGFMVAEARYKIHLAAAKESKQVKRSHMPDRDHGERGISWSTKGIGST